MKKKIIYLVIDERLDNGIIRTQVIDFIKKVALIENITFIYICQLPFLILNFRRYLKILDELKIGGVKVILLPVGLPSRYVLYNNFILKYYSKYLTLIIKILTRYINPHLIHARGYLSSYIAVNSTYLNGKVKVFSDVRSLFLEENISLDKIIYGSSLHKLWQLFENRIFIESSKVLAINDPMRKYIISKGAKKCSIFPIIYNDLSFSGIRNNNRNIHNYIYIGSLGKGHWNNIDVYIENMNKILKLDPKVQFIIVTQKIDEVDEALLISTYKTHIKIIINPSRIEIFNLLSSCTFGMIFMKESRDFETRLGIKSIEYWASGLLIITNKWVGGVVSIIEKYGLGFLIEDLDADLLGKITENQYLTYSNEAKKYAFNNYSLNSVIKKYNEYLLDLF